MVLRRGAVFTTLVGMNKKKPAKDRHKPRRMVGVPERVCAALERMGADRESSLAEMVKTACIEYLEKNGRWPPTAKG
jgi:hypothetical protein